MWMVKIEQLHCLQGSLSFLRLFGGEDDQGEEIHRFLGSRSRGNNGFEAEDVETNQINWWGVVIKETICLPDHMRASILLAKHVRDGLVWRNIADCLCTLKIKIDIVNERF
jgi:hypothetical protein